MLTTNRSFPPSTFLAFNNFVYVFADQTIFNMTDVILRNLAALGTVILPATLFAVTDCFGVLRTKVFPGTGIFIIRTRQSRGRLIFMMAVPTMIRKHLYIWTAPRWLLCTRGLLYERAASWDFTVNPGNVLQFNIYSFKIHGYFNFNTHHTLKHCLSIRPFLCQPVIHTFNVTEPPQISHWFRNHKQQLLATHLRYLATFMTSTELHTIYCNTDTVESVMITILL